MERMKQKVIIHKRSANYLENSCDGIFIFYRSGPRAPDPETGSATLHTGFLTKSN